MIGNVRPWSQATPEDNDYSDYLMDRTVLLDMVPVSHSAYLLLRKMLSTKAQLRPSLAAIRAEVLAMDTFFLSEAEAASYGWADRMEKLKMRKSCAARGVVALSSRRSSETTSSGLSDGHFETCSLGSETSVSCYSTTSSSSAFDSSSAESSDVPATPPARAAVVGAFKRRMDNSSLRVLVSGVAWATGRPVDICLEAVKPRVVNPSLQVLVSGVAWVTGRPVDICLEA